MRYELLISQIGFSHDYNKYVVFLLHFDKIKNFIVNQHIVSTSLKYPSNFLEHRMK